MAKKIMQFRYYGENNDKNQPYNINKQSLASGSIFSEHQCLPIVQLGIQTVPGSKFYLNNGTTPIIIGSTGIYELDLDGVSSITQLSFDPASITALDGNLNGYLIVDIICDVEG